MFRATAMDNFSKNSTTQTASELREVTVQFSGKYPPPPRLTPLEFLAPPQQLMQLAVRLRVLQRIIAPADLLQSQT